MERLGLFLTGAPVWVWPLLVVLLIVGFRASRLRTTLSLPLYFLPLLGILSLSAVDRLSVDSTVWMVFAVVYVLGVVVGYRYQQQIILGKSGDKVTLAGEWLTLGAMMALFWMNFLGGVMKAVAPEMYTSASFHMVFASVAGLVAGSFLGRAARVFITR